MRGGKEGVGRGKGWGREGKEEHRAGEGDRRGGDKGGGLDPPNFETVVAPLYCTIL
jgi:hypothetical protein